MNGILPIYKPRGMVSKDVSRYLTKILGKSVRIGHAGTLDPMAEGVLPVLLGNATRFQDFLISMPKSYEFDVELGRETDSLDDEGATIVRSSIPPFTAERLQQVVGQFVGPLEQVPPLHSAIKFKGKPLYDYVRSGAGEEVPVEDLKRKVRIYDLKILKSTETLLSLSAQCSKGTYVRVLARDIAREIGTVGTVVRLIRTASSGLTLAQTCSLESCIDAVSISRHLVSPESLELPVFRAEIDSEEDVKRLRNGLSVPLDRVRFSSPKTSGMAEAQESMDDSIMMMRHRVAIGFGIILPQVNGASHLRMKRGL